MLIRCFLTILTGIMVSHSVLGQVRRDPPKAEWAIEVVRSDRHNFQFPVYKKEDNIGGAALEHLPRRAGWQDPPDKAPLAGLRLMAYVEGGAVMVKVWAVYSDVGTPDSRPKYGVKEEFLTEFLLPPDEFRVVTEIERVGLLPITLKLVPAGPLPERIAFQLFPQVASKVAGLEVVSVAPLAETEGRVSNNVTWYEVKVANFSGRTVVYLETEREFPLCYCGSYGSREGTLRIAPGETYKLRVGVGHPPRTSLTATDLAQVSTLKYFVSLAIFEDGTYFGDEKRVARVFAAWRGAQIMDSHIVPLLAKLVADYPSGHENAMNAFLRESEKIRIDPDPEEVDKLAARFPSLSRAEIRRELLLSLANAKSLREEIRLWPELILNNPQNYTHEKFLQWLKDELDTRTANRRS